MHSLCTHCIVTAHSVRTHRALTARSLLRQTFAQTIIARSLLSHFSSHVSRQLRAPHWFQSLQEALLLRHCALLTAQISRQQSLCTRLSLPLKSPKRVHCPDTEKVTISAVTAHSPLPLKSPRVHCSDTEKVTISAVTAHSPLPPTKVTETRSLPRH